MPLLWSLRPSGRVPSPVPAAWLHGLACALVEAPEGAHTAQVKPFSARTVNSGADTPVVEIGWLDDTRNPGLEARIAAGGLRLGTTPIGLEVTGRRAVPYAELAASPPALRTRVVFASPTYVSRAGRQIPLPDPELLLSGLARRWRAFSPLPIAEDTLSALLARVFVVRHEIRTTTVDLGKSRRVGFTGEVVFGVHGSSDDPTRRLFAGLWQFAEFAGVGAQTAYGLGSVTVGPAGR
ncbi:CRISPR system precrRNA processing endoribonuclease RAMP protein Cas6 [Thermobifida halotolerans]|uniref:CRISPR system precrRNA processing endoribonuclease RAMP protein Cas6 n=1 Tax=Thermobifida halotolerans TaxID=483545 RepID=A0AA97LW26_9ACTN|nr:CRISPR system precrRNA processing endoribonuclease RAMP protein Cas6 [Thermobifida halotolerans]UOE19093.1 CRISPR system precrRNA processing endoribonuclease RAMP protein Cas6 [Thermobifida halotolerans]